MLDELEQRRITCPYCGEDFAILIDSSAGSQTYTEDCYVCCRPIVIEALYEAGGSVLDLRIKREDE